MNENYLMGKISTEVNNVKAPKGIRDFKGLHSGANKKMEDAYWFIPNIGMIKTFNKYMEENTPQNKDLKTIYKLTENNTICHETRCESCSKYCYCEKSRFYLNNMSSRLNRLLEYLSDKDKLKRKIESQLLLCDVVRLHTEGDFFDVEYCKWWLTIAKENKEVKFYTYTKQFEIVIQAMKELKMKCLPRNFYLQLSYDNNCNYELPMELLSLKRVNVYYTVTKEDIENGNYKKFYDKIQVCKGKCSRCRQCYTKSNYVTLCVIH